MRYVTAVLLLLASIVAFGLGIAQRTIWKPPAEIVATYNASGKHVTNAVISREVLQAHTDTKSAPTVTVSGQGKLVIAMGSDQDINAFVGDQKIVSISAVDSGTKLKGTQTGTSTGMPSPAGSDLWLSTTDGSKTVSYGSALAEGKGLLVSATSSAGEISSIKVSWPMSNTATPLAIPLFITGSALFVGGAIAYLLALRVGRRKRQPKRKSTSTMARVAAPLAIGATVAVAITGCAAGQPAPSSSAPISASASAAPVPPVTHAQFVNIMSKISASADDADSGLDENELVKRFTGAALVNRQAIYSLRKKDSKLDKPSPILAGPVEVFLPTLTASFPRELFAVIQDASSGNQPMALFLTQNTARENYKINSVTNLMPDVKFPELPSETTGAEVVPATSKHLVLPPANVAKEYFKVVAKASGAQNGLFDLKHDQFITAVRQHKTDLEKSLGSSGKVQFSRTPLNDYTTAINTVAGGALVATYVDDSETVTPAKSGGTIEAEGAIKTKLGKSSTKKGYTATYGVMMLFSVPKDGKVTLLGVSQALKKVEEVR